MRISPSQNAGMANATSVRSRMGVIGDPIATERGDDPEGERKNAR